MSQLDKRVAKQLQVLCTVPEYRQVTTPNDKSGLFLSYSASNEYWQYIPNYLVSRCPFCNFVYYAQIDTYRFQPTYYNAEDFQGSIVKRKLVQKPPHCVHYVGNQRFPDRHQPFTERELWGRPRVPGVYSHLLPDDLPSYMVMHALPICEIEDEQFVPRYSLYLTVYFCENPQTLYQSWHQQESLKAAGDNEYYSSFMLEHADQFNFTDWVQRKRICWLDLDDSSLPLRNEPLNLFPYVDLPPPHRGTGGIPHFMRGYKGPVKNPNTVHWEPGALVIHEHDAKKQDLLLVVVGYTRTGLCRIRYRTPFAAKRPTREWAVDLKYLHDPRLFNITLP